MNRLTRLKNAPGEKPHLGDQDLGFVICTGQSRSQDGNPGIINPKSRSWEFRQSMEGLLGGEF